MKKLNVLLLVSIVITGCNFFKKKKGNKSSSLDNHGVATTVSLQRKGFALASVDSIAGNVNCVAPATPGTYPLTNGQATLYGNLEGCTVVLTSFNADGTAFSGSITSGTQTFNAHPSNGPFIDVTLTSHASTSLLGLEGTDPVFSFNFSEIKSTTSSVTNSISVSNVTVTVTGDLAPNLAVTAMESTAITPTVPGIKFTISCNGTYSATPAPSCDGQDIGALLMHANKASPTFTEADLASLIAGDSAPISTLDSAPLGATFDVRVPLPDPGLTASIVVRPK